MNIFASKHRSRVSHRLQVRLGIFAILTAVLLGSMVYSIYSGEAPAWMVLLAFVVGLPLGYLYGRLANVVWHETEDKVVLRIDQLGFIIIGIYVASRFLGEWILADFISGAVLSAVSLALITGILLGRVSGLYISIVRVLRTRPTS